MKTPDNIKFNQSALILPVPEIEEIARPYRSKYTTDGAAGMVAHITILYPFLQQYEMDEQAEKTLHDAISQINPFTFYLVGLNRFDTYHALYLEPEPEDDLLAVIQSIARVFPDHPAYGGSIAIKKIRPHMTIAIMSSTEELDSIQEAFTREVTPLLPIKVTAEELWIFVKMEGRWYYHNRVVLGADEGITNTV